MKLIAKMICMTAASLGLFASCASEGSSITSSQSDDASSAQAVFASIERSSVSNLPVPPAAQNTGSQTAGSSVYPVRIISWAGFDGAASYSYDDGQPSHVQHWKTLKKTNVPMTFYISKNASWIAGYDDIWKDVLASGSELGNHTYNHKKISEYSGSAALIKDIDDSTQYIEKTLGQKNPCSFAYPFGELGWKPYLSGKFLFARTVYSGTVKPLDNTDPLALPIFPVAAGQTSDDFNSTLDNSIREKSWVIFMFHSLLPGDNWYAGVNTDDVTASIGHAKAGGKMWLDTVENIGSYWLAQKMFASLKPSETDNTKTWTWMLPSLYPAGKYLRAVVETGVLVQNGEVLPLHSNGFYEISLDALSLEWRKE